MIIKQLNKNKRESIYYYLQEAFLRISTAYFTNYGGTDVYGIIFMKTTLNFI